MSFPAVIELSELNGANGFQMYGTSANDYTGFSVSHAGDVNDDGIDDLIIGATQCSGMGGQFCGPGVAYVIFGDRVIGNEGAIELSKLNGTTGFRINGIRETDLTGSAVGAAGDLNADGIDDIVVGAYGTPPSNAGTTYVLFGAPHIGSTGVIELSNLNGANGFFVNGIRILDNSGISAGAAGDVNADDMDDLVIGAPYGGTGNHGQAYVIFGNPLLGHTGFFDLLSLNGTNGFTVTGVDCNDWVGMSVGAAGDVNDDGTGDLFLGAPGLDHGGYERAGGMYVLFGAPDIGNNGVVDLTMLDGDNGFVAYGMTPRGTGSSINTAGDVNDDGMDDLIIGASHSEGTTFVLFGAPQLGGSGSMELMDLDGNEGFWVTGVDYGYHSVGMGGDINADGIDDLLIGGHWDHADERERAGVSYVVFGHTRLGADGIVDLAGLDGANGFSAYGEHSRDGSGLSISFVGDVNNDGVMDFSIGAPYALLEGQERAGKAYVIFGDRANSTHSVTHSDQRMLSSLFKPAPQAQVESNKLAPAAQVAMG